MTPARQRPSAAAALLHSLPIIGLYAAVAVTLVSLLPDRAWALRAEYLITLGLFNSWRYSWGLIIAIRSFLYERFAFPAIRRRAERLPAERKYPKHLYLVIATYREQPWISRRMLRSVLRAVHRVPCQTTLYLSTGSEEEDTVFTEALSDHPLGGEVEVVLMRQSGKRSAMANALRAMTRRGFEQDSMVVLMDGDSDLGEDVFEKTLPLFSLMPRLGAVTTDNIALTEGAAWYRDWYNLRFSMRHRQMNAVSLSNHVLALTGRFSVFRAELAVAEKFIKALEEDSLDHWLHGHIRFVTGDDKSTWYTLLQDGWEMLYVPDAVVYCLESSGDQPLRQSFSKMARWFGNMLRNNGRSIRLGPRPMGMYTWWSLIDQRLSIWTTLVGPCTALILGVFKSPYYLVFYLVLATLMRCLYLLSLAMEGHRSIWRDVPLVFFTQWVGSLIKIRVLANLGRQSWGARTGKKAGAATPSALRIVGAFLPLAWGVLFVILLGLLIQMR